jgi:hypothetical protein
LRVEGLIEDGAHGSDAPCYEYCQGSGLVIAFSFLSLKAVFWFLSFIRAGVSSSKQSEPLLINLLSARVRCRVSA